MKKNKKTRRRRQYGAVPFRINANGGLEVLLITSRETGRWIVPKGSPMKKGPRYTAKTEAWEEAGVLGRVHRRPLGTFKYVKSPGKAGSRTRLAIKVYPLQFKRQSKAWPEKGQRKVKWFSLKQAAKRCAEPTLARLIKRLGPAHAKSKTSTRRN